jgi:hypothetical protein
MNAQEQALSLETTSKIATIVNLFNQSFPDGKADLKPWLNDSDTRELIDPDSIDIGFHFPGWSPRLQSRSILTQIRFYEDPETGYRRPIGVELMGMTNAGRQWRFSTIHNWAFEGEKLPRAITQEQLKSFCLRILEVFHDPG